MKLLPAARFLALFSSKKFIVKQKAKLAFDDLAVENFNFACCAKHIPLVVGVGGSPSDISATSMTPTLSSRALRDNKLAHKIMTFPKFSRTMVKTKEEKESEREARKKQKQVQQACRALVALNGTPADSDSDCESSGDELLAGILPKTKPPPKKIALLALPPSDYRIDRCARTTQLLEPACEFERVCWNEDGLNPCEDKSCTDLEDAGGHYQVLKCKKRSSTAAVKHCYNKAKQHYHNIVATHHPDKTKDEAKIA